MCCDIDIKSSHEVALSGLTPLPFFELQIKNIQESELALFTIESNGTNN